MQKIKKYLFVMIFCLASFFLVFSIKEEPLAAESFPFEGMVTGDSLVIYNAASYSDAGKVTELVFGTKVQVLSAVSNKNGNFYKIKYDGNKEGYTAKSYIINYKAYASTSGDYRTYCDSLLAKGFLESYCPQLYYLHKAYPNWTFTPDLTGISLEDASKNEEYKSVLQTGNSNYYLKDTPIETNYYYIKANVIASFMDPRNLMYEQFMFQFLDLEDSKDITNQAAMTKIVGSGNLSNYFNEFANAASTNNINPLHILARSAQEGANKATYSAVTGKYTTNSTHTTPQGYSLDGYYNFYNIGSYQDKKNGYDYTVQRGLAYAAGFLEKESCISKDENNNPYYDTTKCGQLSYQRPWNTPAKAISGGAEFIALQYVRKGQDNLYYQKFNVASYAYYTRYAHQYMTNIWAPVSEGGKLYGAYGAGNLMNSKFNFVIPVYTDLGGESATPIDKNGDATLKEVKINNVAVEGFDGDVLEYQYSVQTNDNSIKVSATANNALTKVEGTGNYTFVDGSVEVNIKTTAEDGTVLNYKLVVKQVKIENEVKVKDVTDKLKVKIDGSYMYGISPGMTAQELINSISSAGGKGELTNSKGIKKTSGNLVTGDIVTITGTIEDKSFTISVTGDVNGDGNVTVLDLLRCQKHILKTISLGGAQNFASDTNFDGKINVLDMLKIQKHILGTSKL